MIERIGNRQVPNPQPLGAPDHQRGLARAREVLARRRADGAEPGNGGRGRAAEILHERGRMHGHDDDHGPQLTRAERAALRLAEIARQRYLENHPPQDGPVHFDRADISAEGLDMLGQGGQLGAPAGGPAAGGAADDMPHDDDHGGDHDGATMDDMPHAGDEPSGPTFTAERRF